jgi:hypothetical protein
MLGTRSRLPDASVETAPIGRSRKRKEVADIQQIVSQPEQEPVPKRARTMTRSRSRKAMAAQDEENEDKDEDEEMPQYVEPVKRLSNKVVAQQSLDQARSYIHAQSQAQARAHVLARTQKVAHIQAEVQAEAQARTLTQAEARARAKTDTIAIARAKADLVEHQAHVRRQQTKLQIEQRNLERLETQLDDQRRQKLLRLDETQAQQGLVTYLMGASRAMKGMFVTPRKEEEEIHQTEEAIHLSVARLRQLENMIKLLTRYESLLQSDAHTQGHAYNGVWLESLHTWQTSIDHALRKTVDSRNECDLVHVLLKDIVLKATANTTTPAPALRSRAAAAAAAAAVVAVAAPSPIINRTSAKQSASATIIGFARAPSTDLQVNARLKATLDARDEVNLNKVAIKISFAGHESQGIIDNSLDVEREVIRYTFKAMLDNHWSPNVVTPIADFSCANGDRIRVAENANSEYQKLYVALLKELKTSEDRIQTSGITHTLIMERGTNTLFNLFEDVDVGEVVLTDGDFYGLLWQVYWTLSCFYRLGIRHNDLHFGNILYRKLHKPEDLVFKLNSASGVVVVRVRTCFIIKFFDMDRGTSFSPGVERNINLDDIMCGKYGECNAPFSLYDLAGFHMELADVLRTIFYRHSDKMWKSSVYQSWFDTVIAHLFDKDTFQRWGDKPLRQYWLASAQKLASGQGGNAKSAADRQIVGQSLQKLLHPEQCLQVLLEQYLVRTLKEEPANYAIAGGFHLPEPHVFRLDLPEIHQLGPNSYEDGLTSIFEAPRSIGTRTTPPMAVTRDTFNFVVHLFETRNTRWKHIFAEWTSEIRDADKLTWDWAKSAFDLFHDLIFKRKKLALHQQPVDCVCALICAALTLSCPMTYGMSLASRDLLRNALNVDILDMRAHESHMISNNTTAVVGSPVPTLDAILVRRAELAFWNAYDDHILPIEIPKLYDLHAEQ